MLRCRVVPGVGTLLVGLLLATALPPLAAQGVVASGTGVAVATVTTGQVVGTAEEPFEPTIGVTLNNPTSRSTGRLVLQQVIRSIRSTEAGAEIRIATWNFDDRPALDALIAAAARGVKVRVVVPGWVNNKNWRTLERALNQDGSEDTAAVQCRGGCRSRSPIMHSKVYMFSQVGTTRHITMVSSSNLTKYAKFRQWNDLVTTRSPKVYAFLAPVLDQYLRDEPVKDPYTVATTGDYRTWVYPVGDRNPQLSQLKKVRCRGATGNTGTPDGRTRIRVAVAGWFDTYGEDIAKRLRLLWDRGCDVRVVATLTGRGVNRALKATYGRGPVPMRQLAWDGNADGVPDRYLHQKSLAISGVFEDDTSASVVLTGSPNWSLRAARSEEVLVRVLDRPGVTGRYLRRVDRLFASRYSSSRVMTPSQLDRALVRHGRTTGQPPQWLELD